MPLPQQQDVMKQLIALRLGQQQRRDIAKWARDCLESARPIGDSLLLRTLVNMAAVDLPGFQHPFLYSHADFDAWMTELDWSLEQQTQLQRAQGISTR
jgi:hypothetical protein